MTSTWLILFVGGLCAASALAVERAETTDAILPGGAIVDAGSIMEAARMDRNRGHSGAQTPCIADALGAPASAPAADGAKPNRLAAMANALRERAQLAGDADKRAQVIRCTEDRRASFVPQRGLDHYQGLLGANTMWLPGLAAGAMGVALDGTPLPAGKASPTCVRSLQLGAKDWRVFPGVLTPNAQQLPPLAGMEAAVSVIDQACYRKTFPNAPIPATVEILTVHQYLDRVVDHRMARVRSAGLVPYAGALGDEYQRLKAGGN